MKNKIQTIRLIIYVMREMVKLINNYKKENK